MSKKVFERLFPEMVLGGYPRHSHKVTMYNRIHAILKPEHSVLDFGAGRGASNLAPNAYEAGLSNLKGKCQRFIGVDVDPVVLENPTVDEAYLINEDGTIPLADESIDIVVSWAVFEHIADPSIATSELERILKPGGWICSFTPNRYGDLAIIATIVPNSLHVKVLRAIGMVGGKENARQDADVFPTSYKLNSARALKKYFPPQKFNHHSYRTLGPPGYNAQSIIVARLMQAYDAITPEFLSRMWHIFIQKKPRVL